MLLYVALFGTASAMLKDNFCWEELEDVAIHPWYDENSRSVTQEIEGDVGTMDDCMATCGRVRTCIGVSWRDEDIEHMHYGKCFFVKRDGGAHPTVEGFRTAIKVRCEPNVCWEEKNGISYNKFNDKTSTETFFSPSSPVSGFQECLDRCTHSSKCMGTTWREEDTEHVHFNKCWFMSVIGEGVPMEGMRSAIRVPCNRGGHEGTACGQGTKLDADTNTCISDYAPAQYCSTGTVWVEGDGCVSQGETDDILAGMSAGKIKGTQLADRIKGNSIQDCMSKCSANRLAVAWAWDTKKDKCLCYSSVKSTKQAMFYGEF